MTAKYLLEASPAEFRRARAAIEDRHRPCAEPGCPWPASPMYPPDGRRSGVPPIVWLCSEHATDRGHCWLCGDQTAHELSEEHDFAEAVAHLDPDTQLCATCMGEQGDSEARE